MPIAIDLADLLDLANFEFRKNTIVFRIFDFIDVNY